MTDVFSAYFSMGKQEGGHPDMDADDFFYVAEDKCPSVLIEEIRIAWPGGALANGRLVQGWKRAVTADGGGLSLSGDDAGSFLPTPDIQNMPGG